MYMQLEIIANSLKGVASIISAMSEVPEGTFVWNEWAMDLLYKELSTNIEKLEKIALRENEVEEDD